MFYTNEDKETMPSNTYLPLTWYDPRAEVRPSSIQGMGMFASQPTCDANLWMHNEVTVVARRDIAVGEELTQDYALYTTSPTWTIKPCLCGTPVCRHTVTGSDWQIPDVQDRYRDHFSPFLNERIRHLRES